MRLFPRWLRKRQGWPRPPFRHATSSHLAIDIGVVNLPVGIRVHRYATSITSASHNGWMVSSASAIDEASKRTIKASTPLFV